MSESKHTRNERMTARRVLREVYLAIKRTRGEGADRHEPERRPMNLWQRFLCNVLGWHSPDRSGRAGFYLFGINLHATCKRCKRDIMQDSQGNWF